MEKQAQARPNWILIVAGLLLIIYGVLCYTTIIPNAFHTDFGFVFIGLGIAAIFWGMYVSPTKKKVLLTEKIMAVEEAGTLRRVLGATLSGCLLIVFFFGLIFMQGPNPETVWRGGQPYVWGGTTPMILAIFLMLIGSLVGAMLIGMSVLVVGRRKVAVTPILVVSEKNPIIDETTDEMVLGWNFGLVFGSIIKSLAGRSNFILSDEGVLLFRPMGLTLIRWKKFKSYLANRDTGEFLLKRGRVAINLTSKKQFDQVNDILSNHIGMV